MKVLAIAPEPFFSPRGTPFSVYFRTLVTSELGHKVNILTYGEGQDVDIPNCRIIRIPRFKIFGNVKVGPSFLKLFLDVFIFFWMFVLLVLDQYDVVHVHEEVVFFAAFLKPLFNYKLVYDMHSSLTQQLSNFKFTTSKLLVNLFKRLEEWSLKSADAIITICPDLYDFVNNLLPNNNKNFLIENSLFEEVRLVNKNGKAKPILNNNPDTNKFKDKKLVVYAGTLEEYQGIDILVNSFQYVIKKNPNVLLYIVGGNKDQVERFRNLAKEKGVNSNIVFTGKVSQSEAKQYTHLANVLVSPRTSGMNTPLKIYEQIASGIPLVATNIHSHTQVLDDNVAFLVNPEPESIAKGILDALKSGWSGSSKRLIMHLSFMKKSIQEKFMKINLNNFMSL